MVIPSKEVVGKTKDVKCLICFVKRYFVSDRIFTGHDSSISGNGDDGVWSRQDVKVFRIDNSLVSGVRWGFTFTSRTESTSDKVVAMMVVSLGFHCPVQIASPTSVICFTEPVSRLTVNKFGVEPSWEVNVINLPSGCHIGK